ncbi:phosphatase PAP2 family protein [uncultured Corynebacterium sp.]|uniref:phosphatase PAP2 family protein n=1 Tax=uncultured Corynebacterium sp. TaxID=159447 RepID=UPI0025EC5A1D|nr:phosphatase PAP2 family protein [uncultured Corynebacterium sp.]
MNKEDKTVTVAPAAGEVAVLIAVQDALTDVPGVLPAARAMSFFGEHALGWMGVGALGAAVDADRRRGWAVVGVSAFASHAASVLIKRVVRRKRPHHPGIRVGVGTPSKLSFPSSHATSTTAALVAMSRMGLGPAPLAGVPAIMLSRLVLGVHYPTDVIAGATLGWTTAVITDKILGGADDGDGGSGDARRAASGRTGEERTAQ